MLQQYDYFVYCFTPMYLLSMLYFNGILRNTVIIMLIGSGDGKGGGGGDYTVMPGPNFDQFFVAKD